MYIYIYITVLARVYAPSSCTWTCAKNVWGGGTFTPYHPGISPSKQKYE